METDPLRICIVGVAGRLGRLILGEVIRRSDLQLVGGVVSSASVQLGADLGELAGLPYAGMETVVDIDHACHDAELVIDVSVPGVTAALARKVGQARGRLRLVSGVTGLDTAALGALKAASETTAVLHARNFSTGVTMMERLVAEAARSLSADLYDLEIQETHHRFKTDAPSGTALALGEIAAGARGQGLDDVARYGLDAYKGPRRHGSIGFSSTRGGGVVGEHEARFLSAFEEVTISHRAFDRFIFARGALDAACWLRAQPPGLYTMHDVIAAV